MAKSERVCESEIFYVDIHHSHTLSLSSFFLYPKKVINTPAATALPITPEILLAIAYCRI